MGKDSFLLYKSFYQPVSGMSDKQLGRLFRAIFKHQLGEVVTVEGDIEMAFNFFVNQFNLDEAKYKGIVERNRENGRKGGAPKGNKNAKNIGKEGVIKKSKQPKQPTGVQTTQNKLNDNDIISTNVDNNNISNINNKSTNVDSLPQPVNVRQISDATLQCQCTSQSTNEQCKRKALYEIDGKLYCNQHSRDVLGDIIKNNPNNLFMPDEKAEKSDYEKFNDWIKSDVPNVLKLQRQITEPQFLKMKELYDTDQIIFVLRCMDNYKDLTKKYVSAYQTFLNWAKREYS